jgi:hypothetical protein
MDESSRPRPTRGDPATSHALWVTLARVSPPVWREILLPSDATLATLHAAIQAAFPWSNAHLHCFDVGKSRFEAVEGDPDASRADERRFTLSDVLPRVGSTLRYTYDFANDWLHEVRVEALRPNPPGAAASQVQCLSGARAAPPDDCGGESGYEELLAALSRPNHARHAELSRWLASTRGMLASHDPRYAGPFDPEAFDLAAANRALARVRR